MSADHTCGMVNEPSNAICIDEAVAAAKRLVTNLNKFHDDGVVLVVDREANDDIVQMAAVIFQLAGHQVIDKTNDARRDMAQRLPNSSYSVKTDGTAWKSGQSSYSAKRSVLQDWTNELSWMMQSVLITACRGPDGIRKDHPVKVIIRYLRRSFLICAFDGKVRWSPYEAGGGSFTGPLNLHGMGEGEGHLDKYAEIYLRYVDELPHHFQLHLMHAAEILGYKHPDGDVRSFWRMLYLAIVNDAHLSHETEAVMDKRLGDNEAAWRTAELGEGNGAVAK